MSYIILNSSSQFFRLGFINASKILSTSSSAPTTTALTSSFGSGRAFTGKYYHTLSQKKQNGQLAITSSSINLSSALKNNKELCSRLMSSEGHDHVRLWTMERILSGALVPLIPMALIMPCAPLDYMVAFALTVHSHWGIEALVLDYVRPSVFGEVIPKIAMGLVYGLSAMTLGGLFYFIYSDVGIANAIRMFWKL